MKVHKGAGSRGRRGFSLLEIMVATTIFSVVGYALSAAMNMAKNSHAVVVRAVSDNGSLRDGLTAVSDDMQTAGEESIEVVQLEGGNSSVDFMHPIDVAGELSWGVYDRKFGETEEEHNHDGWRVRYTVDSQAGPQGVTRTLLRQVLNEEQVLQSEETLLSGLRSGTSNPPGFRVAKAGYMWEITITMTGYTEDGRGRGALIHVRTRN